MDTNHMINDMEWQKLIADVGEQFSDVTIKRGFQYYKQGFVRETRPEGPGESRPSSGAANLWRLLSKRRIYPPAAVLVRRGAGASISSPCFWITPAGKGVPSMRSSMPMLR